MNRIQYKHSANIYIKGYEVPANILPFTGKIETFDSISLADLSGTVSKINNTRIKATFESDFTTHPDYPFSFYGIIEVDTKSTGGISFIRQISTIIEPENDTPFVGLNGNLAKITVTTSPDKVVVEADLDISKLPSDLNNYKLSARVGRITPHVEFCLLQENGDSILMESGDCIEHEH